MTFLLVSATNSSSWTWTKSAWASFFLFFFLMQTPDRTDWNFGMTGFRTLRTWLIGQCLNSRWHMSSVCNIAVFPFLSSSSWFSLWRGTSVTPAVSQSAVERSESSFCSWQRRPWMQTFRYFNWLYLCLVTEQWVHKNIFYCHYVHIVLSISVSVVAITFFAFYLIVWGLWLGNKGWNGSQTITSWCLKLLHV